MILGAASMTPSVLPLCMVGDVGCYAREASASAFEAIVDKLGEAVVTMVSFMSTFWLSVPSPTVATGDGGSWALSGVLAQMQSWLGPVTGVVALSSFAVAIGRIAFTGQAGQARLLLRQVVAVASGTLAVAATTQLLIRAGDAFSPWIISQASDGRAPSDGLKTLIEAGFQSGSPTGDSGLWFLMFILCALGAIVQCVFMLVRGAAMVVLMVLVAPTAAGAASDEGWARFKRLGLLLLGFTLYKPVAAVIYAVGIMEMTQQNGGAGNDVQNALYGLTIMVMAALALPAFIKFLMPLAAMGSSSVFSGATAAGLLAGGAAVVATGVATGGLGAAAGGGAAAASMGSAGATGATGAAGSGGAPGAAGGRGPAGAAPSVPPSGASSGGPAAPGAAGASTPSGGPGGSGPVGAPSVAASGRAVAQGVAGALQSAAGHATTAGDDAA